MRVWDRTCVPVHGHVNATLQPSLWSTVGVGREDISGGAYGKKINISKKCQFLDSQL